jgi:hypothetical protein
MSSFVQRASRRITHPVRRAAAPAFEQLERRLLLLEEKLDRINHLVATIEVEAQESRHQILAARHEAHTLMVTDIDAANEATALLGRSLADHRDMVEERLDRVEDRLQDLTAAVEKLADRLEGAVDGGPPG